MDEISTFPRHMGCTDKEYFLVLKGQMVDIVAVGHGTLNYPNCRIQEYAYDFAPYTVDARVR
jgi:hypothetical protein